MTAGRRAVVTGASNGIGLAIARALQAAGAEVIGVDIEPGKGGFETIGVDLGAADAVVDVARRLAEHLGEETLTGRELEVLRLIRDGHRNKQIADELTISETTVNFHIKNLVDKLQANDRTHAVTIALRRGILHI